MAVFQVREVINEAYFGRTPGIDKIIKQIGVVRRKFGVYDENIVSKATGYKSFIKIDPHINSDDEMLYLNRLFEEEFGFGTFCLTIQPNENPGANTVPISFAIEVNSMDLKKHVKSSKTGFKFDKAADFSAVVFMTSGIFLNNNLSDEEICAIILHEIGHNFQAALSGKVAAMNTAYKVLYHIQTVMSIVVNCLNGQGLHAAQDLAASAPNLSNKVRKFTLVFKKELSSTNDGKNVLIAIDSITGAINTMYSYLDDLQLATNILTILGNITVLPLMLVRQLTGKAFPLVKTVLFGGYRGEQIADTFAAMYGLGPELSSGLSKLQKNTKTLVGQIIFETPILGHIVDCCIILPVTAVSHVFDEHPTNAARHRNITDALIIEAEKTDLDPKMRKKLKEEVKRMEDTFDAVYNHPDKSAIQDTRIASRTWNAFLYKSCGGDFKHYAFKTEDNIKDIDKTYAETSSKNIIGKGLAKIKFK